MRRRVLLAKQSAQRGQAMVEYLVVTLWCVIVLVVASSDSPAMTALRQAVKGFFKAFSFAISITPQ